MANTIEAILGVPPEREEMVVQLFFRDGGQWGEVYRDNGEYYIDIYHANSDSPLRLNAGDCHASIERAVVALKERLE